MPGPWAFRNRREGGAAEDALEALLDDSTPEELEAIFGRENATILHEAYENSCGNDALLEMGGWLVMGLFRPPDKDRVTFRDSGKACGWSLACYQPPCVAWHPHLHTVIGKCLSLAVRENRAVIKTAEEAERNRHNNKTVEA